MAVIGIDEITFGVQELGRCRQFMQDWGLTLKEEHNDTLVFESLNGCKVIAALSNKQGLPPGIESDPTAREVVWCVDSTTALDTIRHKMKSEPGFVDGPHRIGCIDPNGLAVRVQVSQKHAITISCAQTNTWNERERINQPSPSYTHAQPIEVGHVVFFVKNLDACTRFYEEVMGFVISDRYPGRGHFFRCTPEGGHHDLFLLQTPEGRCGLNHVAFTVRDIHEVFGGGMHISRCGWDTELGPGRHPVSSAIFWYVNSPLGALWEYYTDEDELTADWQPREFAPGPTVFAEWAIKGGIDGNTRRQIQAEAPSGQFMTDKPKAKP